MQGKPADDKENAWATNEQLRAGLERIRKLDIILARKTKVWLDVDWGLPLPLVNAEI